MFIYLTLFYYFYVINVCQETIVQIVTIVTIVQIWSGRLHFEVICSYKVSLIARLGALSDFICMSLLWYRIYIV